MTRPDDAAPVLTLMRAAGLRGFGSDAVRPIAHVATDAEKDAAPVLAIVRAAGLSGFKISEPRR